MIRKKEEWIPDNIEEYKQTQTLKMHFAVVTEGLPHPGTSGGSIFMWTVLKHLMEAGHRVTACVVMNQFDIDLGPVEQKHRAMAVSDLGAEVEMLTIPKPGLPSESQRDGQQKKSRRRLRQFQELLHPRLENFYPSIVLAPELRGILGRARPDAVYVFDTGPVAALQDMNTIPRMATPGDPLHLAWPYRLHLPPLRERMSRSYILNLFAYMFAARKLPRWIIQMLSKYESVGFLGAQHAAWVRENGVECLYLPLPLIDMAGPEWRKRRDRASFRGKPKILMLGQPVTTAGLTGLYFFAKQILPVLEREMGTDGFEVLISGRGTLPPDLKSLLARPSVHMRGYVDDAAREFSSADLVLAPAPYPVGVRVRIVHALSFGCCVVAHRSSALGIPELVHEENALLATDGPGLASAVIWALKDIELRTRLGVNARRTYEANFYPNLAVGKIISELERIARRHGRVVDRNKGSL